jgi:hypothetical protein
LNALIASDQHRRFHDEVALVWWANQDAPDLMAALFEGTRPEDVAHKQPSPRRFVVAGWVALASHDVAVVSASPQVVLETTPGLAKVVHEPDIRGQPSAPKGVCAACR